MSRVFSAILAIVLLLTCIACSETARPPSAEGITLPVQSGFNRIDYFTGITVEDIMRYPDDYLNKKVYLTSYKIKQIYEPKIYLVTNGTSQLMIDDTKNDGPNGLEGDMVTVYGKFKGNEMVKWVDGSTGQIPYIVADKLVFNNVAPDGEEFAKAFVEMLNMSPYAYSYENEHISGTQVKLVCRAQNVHDRGTFWPFACNELYVDGYKVSNVYVYYNGLKVGYKYVIGTLVQDNFDVLPIPLFENNYYILVGDIYLNVDWNCVEFHISDIINEISTYDFERITPTWKKLYLDFIRDYITGLDTSYYKNEIKFYLKYINNDKIPELLISVSGEIYEIILCTSDNNAISAENVGKYVNYIEHGNVLSGRVLDHTKQMWIEKIYTIDKGQIKLLHEITEDITNPDQSIVKWDGVNITSEEYNERRNKILDESKIAYFPSYGDSSNVYEMINKIIDWEEPDWPAEEPEIPSSFDNAGNAQEIYVVPKAPEGGKQQASQPGEVSSQNNTQSLPAWKQLYINYINDLLADPESSIDYDIGRYALVYVNNDDIPELLIYGTYASGTILCTVGNDKLSSEIIGNYDMQYIERGNICIGYGGKEISYERFFAIEDGKIKKLHEGSYGAMNLYTGEAPIYEYTWDGEKISGEEYNRKVSGVIDKSKAKYPPGEELCKADEMIDKIIAW